MVQGRCFTCKKQVDIQNPELVTLDNGRKMVKGKCACGTKVNAFVKADFTL